MKIVYFYQYFCTPKGFWGTRVYEFARRWVSEGHRVTVVTAVHDKSDMVMRPGLLSRFELDGIDIIQLNIDISNKHGNKRRIQGFLSYAAWSSLLAVILPADVVIASSGPLTVGIPGLFARYLRKRRLVFEVRDLWPEGSIQLDVLRGKRAQAAAFWLARRCYRAADDIVTLSPGMTDWLKREYTHLSPHTVTNASDLELFGGAPNLETVPPLAQTRKIALYPGNLGDTNQGQLLLDAALELQARGRNDITVVLIGDGPMREELVAKSHDLDTLEVLPLLPKTELVHWVKSAMAVLVTFKPVPVLQTNSPNKLFEALAAGVPVVQTTEGWMRDLVDQHGCGLSSPPDDAGALASCLERLADNPDEAATMGRRARQLAEGEFSRDHLAERMLKIVVGDSRRRKLGFFRRLGAGLPIGGNSVDSGIRSEGN